MSSKKPRWKKPKLVILTKGRPEEVILYACKHYTLPGGTPEEYYNYCTRTTPTCGDCVDPMLT